MGSYKSGQRSIIGRFITFHFIFLVLFLFFGSYFIEYMGKKIKQNKDYKVVIFVIDSFKKEIGSKKSHGTLVSDIVRKECYGDYELKQIDISSIVKNDETGESEVKLDNDAYYLALKKVINYTKEHPKDRVVVNLSLGSMDPTYIEKVLIRELNNRGVVMVAAAGNLGIEELLEILDSGGKLPKFYPAAYEYERVIAVASVEIDGERAFYSGFGKYIDIATQPHKSINAEDLKAEGINSATLYYSLNDGTSYSAPRVAGIIGYLMQNPELSFKEINSFLRSTARSNKEDFFHKNGLLGAGCVDYTKLLLKADPLYRKTLWARNIGIIIFLIILFLEVIVGEDSTIPICSGFFGALAVFCIIFFAIYAKGIIVGSILGASELFLIGILTVSIAPYFWYLDYLESLEEKKKKYIY